MRKLVSFVLSLSLLLTLNLSAQDAGFREVKKGMNMGVKEAFTVDVSNLSEKEVKSVLDKYLKKYKGKAGLKKVKRSKEMLMDDAEIPAISGNTIDLYTQIEGNGENSSVTFWFDLGGAFLSEDQHPEKMEALSEWLYGFGKETRVRTVELEMEMEEKKLKDMNKEYDKLKKEEEKLQSTIEKAKETIAKAEQDLIDNAAAQKNRQDSIVEQQKNVEKVKDKLKKVN